MLGWKNFNLTARLMKVFLIEFMIEVEKKFILTEKEKERLIKGAEFLNEKVFTDIYYDTNDFSLTSNDRWLRSRDGKFELKIPIHQGADRLIDQYNELEDEQKIREALSLFSQRSISDDLARRGYYSFCTCKTTRRKYKKGLFIIDLDIVDFNHFTYTIGEIELMVNKKSEIKTAIGKIMSFAQEHNLNIAPARGKVIEYLKRMRADHYHSLIRAGVVKDY